MGGDATAVDALARTQRRRGHDVDVVAYRGPGIAEDEHTHLVGEPQTPDDLDRITLGRFFAMRALEQWGRRRLPALKPEVIHAHAVDVGLPLARAARPLGIPVVLTCHGVWFPTKSRYSLSGRLERSMIRKGRYAAVTSVDAASVAALQGAGYAAAIEIPNGVDLDEFRAPPSRDGPFRFLFVGRHVPQKGIEILLKAAAMLRERGTRDFGLDLAGQGPLTDSLKVETRALGLADTVQFLGPLPRPDLLAAYRRAHAFVLPSRHEGFPIAILEAWASGLPVLATSVGGIPEVCNSQNAILAPPEDPAALADGMKTLISQPSLGDALARAGRSLVEERFTWDAIADRYDTVYRDARAAGGGSS